MTTTNTTMTILVKIYEKKFKGETPDYDIIYKHDGLFEAYGMLFDKSSIIVSTGDGTILNLPIELVKFKKPQ